MLYRDRVGLRTGWTAEQDEQLRRAVAMYGESNWQQVAAAMPGRTGQQCLHRWQKSINPKIRRARWTPEEDKLLMDAVKLYGHAWSRVQHHVPNRTDVQCRERWMNILNPELQRTSWTPEVRRLAHRRRAASCANPRAAPVAVAASLAAPCALGGRASHPSRAAAPAGPLVRRGARDAAADGQQRACLRRPPVVAGCARAHASCAGAACGRRHSSARGGGAPWKCSRSPPTLPSTASSGAGYAAATSTEPAHEDGGR